MKIAIRRFGASLVLLIVVSWGCGGSGGTGSGALPDISGNPAVGEEQPAGNGDAADSSATNGESTAAAPSTPPMVRITGALRDAEAMGVAGATITFHSDPVTAVTDANGFFSTLLDVGSHTFEIATLTGETVAGEIEVIATSFTNAAEEAIGQFIATATSIPVTAACLALQLVDLGLTTYGNTGYGIFIGTFGQELFGVNEVDAQGVNETAIITGNSWMTANISLEDRLNALWFPSVGAFNHVPHLSGVAAWMKPFQGSFLGLKRGEDFSWFTDTTVWNPPEISYLSGTYAPIVKVLHQGLAGSDCAGTTVTEKIYVSWNAYASGGKYGNILLRDVSITVGSGCSNAGNSTQPQELALYARFNPNAQKQLFGQWLPDAATTACDTNTLTWTRDGSPSYTIGLDAMSSTGSKLAMTTCIPQIETLEDAWRVVDDAACLPGRVRGSIATWQLPLTKRAVVSTAGCEQSGALCTGALAYARSIKPATLESTFNAQWTTWVNSATSVGSAWVARYKRWLVTIKMLADRNTGAIIASPSQEPTYYPSWPRDGVYQSLAFMLAGKEDVAANFFRYLFNKTTATDGTPMETQSADGGWTQAHSSLDGSHLGLPQEVSIELDQPPTVLWGLWVYWTLKSHALPTGIGVADIEKVADYIVDRMCPFSGLVAPSLDWHENPYRDVGQSIYTNAAAYAGLLAAADMVEATHASEAAEYRARAAEIRGAVEEHLCTSSTCHCRIKYGSFGAAAAPSCDELAGGFLMPEFSDEDGEQLMAFAWPFHLFDLGDARVQSSYATTAATYDDYDAFSADHCLWVVRPLMSHLYALAATSSDELSAGAFKSQLESDITDLESRLDTMTTAEGGYLMDQFTNDPERVGTASRPLGWSQALGALTALAHSNKYVPLIEAPLPATDCTIGSGPCCDAAGVFRPTSFACNTGIIEYGCPGGTACDSDVSKRTNTQYCSGAASACTGAVVTGSWTAFATCSASQKCVAGNPVCQSCAACACSTGACCDGCNYRTSSYTCQTDEEFQCAGPACGDNLQHRTRTKSCSGSSALCDTSYGSWSGWTTAENCSSDELCNASAESCDTSDTCSECIPGSGPCCDSSGNFRSTTYVCNSSVSTIRECHSGTDCGDDVYQGVQKQNCSGSSSSCSGATSWTWSVYQSCDLDQKCSDSDDACHDSGLCCAPISWTSNLHATDMSGKVRLTWTAVSGATGYVITRMPGSGSCPPTPAWDLVEVSAGTTSYDDTGLTAPACATYGIFALNECGEPGACSGIDVGCEL